MSSPLHTSTPGEFCRSAEFIMDKFEEDSNSFASGAVSDPPSPHNDTSSVSSEVSPASTDRSEMDPSHQPSRLPYTAYDSRFSGGYEKVASSDKLGVLKSSFSGGNRVSLVGSNVEGVVLTAKDGQRGPRLDNEKPVSKRGSGIQMLSEEPKSETMSPYSVHHQSMMHPSMLPTPAHVVVSTPAAVITPTPAHVVVAAPPSARSSTSSVTSEQLRRKRPNASKMEWTQGQEVLIAHGKGAGKYATVISSGHGFIAVNLDGKKLQKRVSELDLVSVGNVLPTKRYKYIVKKELEHDDDVRSAAKLLLELGHGGLDSVSDDDGEGESNNDPATNEEQMPEAPGADSQMVESAAAEARPTPPEAASTSDLIPSLPSPRLPQAASSDAPPLRGNPIPSAVRAHPYVAEQMAMPVRYAQPSNSMSAVPAISIHDTATQAYSHSMYGNTLPVMMSSGMKSGYDHHSDYLSMPVSQDFGLRAAAYHHFPSLQSHSIQPPFSHSSVNAYSYPMNWYGSYPSSSQLH